MKRRNHKLRSDSQRPPGKRSAYRYALKEKKNAFIKPHCPTGRVAHLSRRTAKLHLKRLRSVYHEDTVSVYRCRTCGNWHVGHDNQPKP